MMRAFIFILVFMYFLLSSNVNGMVDFSNQCKIAHSHTMKFEFSKANTFLAAERKINPQNLVPSYIETYRLFLETAISENENIEKTFFQKSNKTIENFEKETAYTSPYVNYCLADLYIQQAFMYFKSQSYLPMVNNLRKALSSLEKNEKQFPDFIPNKKLRGIINIGFGSVPQQYNWVLTLFDIKASVNIGLLQLSYLSQQSIKNPLYHFLRTESILISTFTSYNLGNNKESLSSMLSILETDSLQEEIHQNPLLSFVKMAAYQNKKLNDKAIETYKSYKNEGKELGFYFIDFMMGECLLYKLDLNASTYFQNYLKNFRGKSYKRAAYQKLAWLELLNNNTKGYKQKMENCKIAPYSFVDADKQAFKEASENLSPNIYLLKARLLFDGGYYSKARTILLQKNASEIYKTKRDLLEFYYRMGRIYHDWGQIENAHKYYELTIEKGKSEKYYFAANAALQSGLLYEQQKEFKKAKEMYQLCLLMKYDEYQNSISQKAKAGLNRLELK